MREIKFRAWDSFNAQFVYSDIMGLCDGARPSDFRVLVSEGQAKPIEQYTGLYDKNGKEICEGDILQYYSALVPKGSNPLIKTVVVWSVYRWRGINNWGSAEIAGNIHENPELLNG